MINLKLLIVSIIIGSEIILANLQKVERCNCYMLGTFEDTNGKSVCDENKVCSCLKNVIGKNCDKCKDGYFGILNGNGCSFCACNSIGALSRNCEQKTGQCPCKKGFTGFKCEKCSNFAPIINGKCCECNPNLSQTQYCDENTAKCKCKRNAEGDYCEKCKSNYKFNNNTKFCEKCDSCYENMENKIRNFEVQIKNITKSIETTEGINKKQLKDAIAALNKLMGSLWAALSLKNTPSISKLGQIFLVTENLIKKTAELVNKSKISHNQSEELEVNYNRTKLDYDEFSRISDDTKHINLINFKQIYHMINELQNKSNFLENNMKEVLEVNKDLQKITKKFTEQILSNNDIYNNIIRENKFNLNISNEIKMVSKETTKLLKKGKNLRKKVIGLNKALKLPFELLPEILNDHRELFNNLTLIEGKEGTLADLEKQAMDAHEFMQKSALNRTKRVQALVDTENTQFSKLLNKKLDIDEKLARSEKDCKDFLKKLDHQKLYITITSKNVSELLLNITLSNENIIEVREELNYLTQEIKNIEKYINDFGNYSYNILKTQSDLLKYLEDYESEQVNKFKKIKKVLKKLQVDLKEAHEAEEIYGTNTKLMKLLIELLIKIDDPKLFNELSEIQARLAGDYKNILELNIDDLKDEVKRIGKIAEEMPSGTQYCIQNKPV